MLERIEDSDVFQNIAFGPSQLEVQGCFSLVFTVQMALNTYGELPAEIPNLYLPSTVFQKTFKKPKNIQRKLSATLKTYLL